MIPARRLFLVLALAACRGTGDGAGGRATAALTPTTRDSAGVTIHEHPADALERAPRIAIDSAPLAVFAGNVNDPSLDVSGLLWPIFLRSGDLVAFDRQEFQLLVLRVGDGSRRRLGHRGSGPGEIGFPSQLIPLGGDSLLFADLANDRLTIATSDSGVIRSIARGTAEGLSGSDPIGRVGDSLYLLAVPGPREAIPSSGRVNMPRHIGYWLAGTDSVRRRFTVPSGWTVLVQFGQGIAQFGLPLAGRTRYGRWGDGILIAPADRWVLEHWDTAGQLREEIRIAIPARQVDDAMFDRYVEADVAETAANFEQAGREANLDSMRAAVRARGHADSVAAYDQVNVTPNGTIWVTDVVLPGDSGWAATALDADGRILGRIEMASGEAPIAWGDDRVAFKSEDDNGIATITIKRLRMPE